MLSIAIKCSTRSTHTKLLLLALVVSTSCLSALAEPNTAAAELRSHFAALHDHLVDSPFGRPLVLESSQSDDDLKGDIYAVLDQPYATVAPALRSADHWCDILILHLNVKSCRVSAGPPKGLTLYIGTKHDEPIADSYRVDLSYRASPPDPDYMLVQLHADNGPLGTRDYRIRLEAVPAGGKTFVHMSYSYGYGIAARIALQAYLDTIGRDKVGFSISGRQPGGQPDYVGGVLGLVERNTMRYYLAIESYLGAAQLPESQQVERRLHDWHAGVDRYARQLHELSDADYLTMKRKEIARQAEPRTAPPS